MVVSQHQTTNISKNNDTLTINTKQLKVNMDNKKKKRKNSIKSLEIKENLNKQAIKEKENKLKNKITQNENEIKEKQNHEEEKENGNVLQTAIDFDEDFWFCSQLEREDHKELIVNNECDSVIVNNENNEECENKIEQESKTKLCNGYAHEEKYSDFYSEEEQVEAGDNLEITLQIYSKEHNGKTSPREDLQEESIKEEEEKTLLTKKETNNEDRELSEDAIVNESLNSLREKEKDTSLSPALENGNLSCSSNCVCFCNEGGAHQVLSIVENGYLINHNSGHELGNEDEQGEEEVEEEEADQEEVDDDDDLDESDLPNYSRSCVYEERIIDFENFRIIEQVIDNNCEGKHTAANKTKCSSIKESENTKEDQVMVPKNKEEIIAQLEELPSSSQLAQTPTTTPIYVNPSLNFSCSELVAFIGESYQVIDNAQAIYNNDKTNKLKKSTQFKTKESSSVGNSPFKRSKRSGYTVGNAVINRGVDDNNNTRRYTGITAAERLMQSLNCDVARELTQARRVEKREVKVKSKTLSNNKTPTPTKTLLKALKSKLTPLAPPFQPAAIKNKELKVSSDGGNANNSSSSLLNYEQTTIYYQQQQLQQQQHQQQQQQHLVNNNMLQALSLITPNQQQQLMQQQQVSPSQHQQQQQQLYLAQQQHQHHNLQLHHPSQQTNILQTLNAHPHHHQHHHHHCAQNILTLTGGSLTGQGMPHIHLPATATTANNNGNLSSQATAAAATVINVANTNPNLQQHHHHHLLPIHLISAIGNGNAGGTLATTWPLLEANNSLNNTATTTAAIYMDINGEIRSICPAHGAPPTAVTLTTPLAPITNQASGSTSSPSPSSSCTTTNHPNIMQQQQQQQHTICLNSAQYPLTITAAQYNAAVQHQQQQQLQHHTHLQQQQQQQHHHHHLPILANSQQQQQSLLRIKSSATTTGCASSTIAISTASTSNSATTPISSSSSVSSSAAASAASTAASSIPPRVVLQLDAGVSLPLQIAGKRKIFRGPTTVQMVSQNRPPPPPMPVPVQVPQGQVMQPYVNESGTLTHVVLSPQQYQQLHAGQGHMHPPFLTTNGTSHFYTPIPGGFPPPGAGGQGPGPYQVGPHGHMAPPPQSGTPQPQQSSTSVTNSSQQQQHSPASHSANHSPSPPNNYHKDERTQRQHTKLLRKLDKQRSAVSSPTHSPSPRRQEPQMNGHNTNNNGSLRSQHNNNNNSHHQRKQQQQPHQQQQQQRNGNVSNYNNRQGASSVASSEEGDDNFSLGVNGANGDEEEDYQASIVEQLSTIQKPEVTDITSRSAKIVWEAPPCISESALQLINTRELRYNVLLSDRAKDGKYKSLYKGSSYDCIVQDLKPGQEYFVSLQVHYEHLHGTPSEPTEFTTPACEPDRPAAPRMVMCTKNSLHLRWNNPPCNGSSIQHYLLEYDEGKTGGRVVNESACKFVEAVKTKGKQYIMTKLQPSTIYNFRLAAVNEVGPSAYSPVCTFSTQGNPPSAPKPPTLQAFNSSSLKLIWERRQSDGATCIYVLQMLDRASGHGYLNMYNGQDCSYECCQLRRATLYYFRLRAENEAGASAWSNEVAYKTAPERPGRPGKPYAKGKIHGTHFRVRWEPPTDNGGAEIQRYYLEINAGGQKFDRIYTGVECEATCDRLQPGTTYQLRASCEGPGGLSPYSEVSHITSEAVVPAAPPSPYYDNPPGPYAAVLRLDKPEYNGGAPILEFELQLRKFSDQDTPRIVYRGKDAYCVIKDLQPGNQYEVQVRAINRIGAGAWSPWFKFSSAAAAPNCPESLKVIIKSATQLHVSWQEPANKGGAAIAEYRLESATASNVSNASESSTPQPPPSSAFHTCYQGLQTSADIRNLMPFTYYYFRVNACNMAGVSKWSPLVNCQTPAAVPSAPQIKDLEFTSNEATLRWSTPECNGSDIINYSIEYAERTIITSDNATEYTVTNLQPETSYKFRVQAINAIGSGPYSLYAKLTTLPSPPSPPKLECSGVGHNFIKLKWGDGKNLDFTKFYVEMFVQRAKEFQVVYSGTNCMCKVNKLQERTAYTFRICAGNDRAGVGEYSEEFVFSTSACLPNSIKAPRIAQNLPTAASSSATSSSASANNGSTPSASSSAGVIPSGLLPETPSFLTGLGNLMLGVPLTLEWQHSKNSFSDRVEYMLQYAIGKDGEFKKIYRGSETKFTIENLEPGGLYQFRVCPIRVTNNGEDLMGAFTSAFRHQVPLIPSLDDIDGNLLGNAAAQMFAGLNAASGNNSHAPGSCHGHSHHHAHHSHMGGHSHHHNPLHSHHNSRHSGHHNSNGGGSNDTNSNSNLHHRSVSASAGSSSSSSNSSSSKNSNSNANNTPSNNTLLIGSNAIGFIPIGSMASELAASFAGCDDPNHHHHHHHHAFPDVANQLNATASSTSGNSSNSSNNPQSAASLLAASANQLFANNPILLQAATAAISHHQHVLGHHHGGGAHNQNAGALRRFVTKISSVYSNRKRFSDQEKAVIFMVSFLFFTFLFATLVKMFMR